jgi:hypothetical protein
MSSEATPGPVSTPGAYALRVALVFGDTVLREHTVADRARFSIGHDPRSDFVLSTVLPAARRFRARKGRRDLLRDGRLQLDDDLGGKLWISGVPRAIEELRAAGASEVPLGPEDWGVVHLRHAPWIRIVVQRVRGEVLPPLPRDDSSRPLWLAILVSAFAFGLLMLIAVINHEPPPEKLSLDEVDERFARVMFNQPQEDPPPSEDVPKEVSEEKSESVKGRKRHKGPEGTLGRPDLPGETTIRPKGPATGDLGSKGVVKHLDALAQTGAVGDLLDLGDRTGGFPDGEIIIGGGNYGTGTRGGGQGGGGEGEGELLGTSDVDVGGAGSGTRRGGKPAASAPKERKVEVKTGSPSVSGQLSPELINKVVRSHKAQIKYCYEKQLTRFPSLSGKVTLTWVIGMDGGVKSGKVKSSTLGNSDVESCMVRAVKGWTFPKPQGGVVSVDAYPFIFGAT